VSAAVLPCVCAWCERWRTRSGEWRDPDAPGSEASEVTHGICPQCLAQEESALARQESHP